MVLPSNQLTSGAMTACMYRSFQWEVSLKIPVSEVRQLTTGIEQDLSISQ